MRYSDWRILGKGGTANVYRAFDTELGCDVAVKLLKPEILSNPESRATMLRGLRSEVLISRRLRHECICPIHDLYDGPEGIGLVMDIVDGGELRDWMDKNKNNLLATAQERLNLLRRLAGALSVAHTLIVHRDLKPANIFLRRGENGQPDINKPVIMDFGFSVVGETTTKDDSLAYTPKYMAPEQWESPHSVDRRADLFALGIMAYELFTDQIPPNSLRNIMKTRKPPRIPLEMIDPPSKFCPKIPPALDRLILQLTAYLPEQRVQSAEDLAAALRSIELREDEIFGDRRKDRAAIPGGPYYLGTRAGTPSYKPNEGPGKRVSMTPFEIDVYPVTNRDYLLFCEKTGWRRPPLIEHEVFGRPDHPVVAVTFDDAREYARWAGGTLPSEAQWECAARGGKPFAEYPWGNEDPDSLRANLNGAGQGTSPVDAFPGGKNPFGLFDMCGNVWEWCGDVYDEDFYRMVPTDAINPVNLRPSGPRALRGGSFQSFASQGRCAFRSWASPDEMRNDIGFRVAYLPSNPT